MDGLTRAGLVERRVWDHRERGRPVEAPDDIRPSMQPHRGHPDRARDLLHHYHFLPSRWARESERPQLDSLLAHKRAHRGTEALVCTYERGVSFVLDGISVSYRSWVDRLFDQVASRRNLDGKLLSKDISQTMYQRNTDFVDVA